MNNLCSFFAKALTAKAQTPFNVPIRTSMRSSLMNLVAGFTARAGLEASSASRIATGRPSTPPRLLKISTATCAMHIVNGRRLVRTRQWVENSNFDRLSAYARVPLAPDPIMRLSWLAQTHPRSWLIIVKIAFVKYDPCRRPPCVPLYAAPSGENANCQTLPMQLLIAERPVINTFQMLLEVSATPRVPSLEGRSRGKRIVSAT